MNRFHGFPCPLHHHFTLEGDSTLVRNITGTWNLGAQAHAGGESAGNQGYLFPVSWLSPVGFIYSVNVQIRAPGVPGQSAHLQEQAVGEGRRWAGGHRAGCCPNSLPRSRTLCGDTCRSCQPAAPAIEDPPRRAPPGPRHKAGHSGGCHPTDGHRFIMTSIRGSAFSELSLTGLGK